MKKLIPALAGAVICSACGVADTAVGAATVAQAKKQELESARAAQEKIMQQLNQSQRTAEDRLKAAEEANR